MAALLLFGSVFIWEKIYFFDKRRKRNIGLENKVGIKAALGNTVYAFLTKMIISYSKFK